MGEFKHKHSLGQNFLKDKGVLAKIIDSVDVQSDDLVIEIGPGQGALTRFLKLYKANLLCFEIDKRVEKYLKGYNDDKTHIVFEDFMSVDLNDYISDISYNNLYIVANLPYYITTPIIEKIVNSCIDVTAMVLMVQNEVADRLAAKVGTKNYGAMTVILGYYFDVEKLFFVSRRAFEPAPNVDSAVIKLFKREKRRIAKDETIFLKLVHDSFKMKRKNIRNNLRSYDLNLVESVLSSYGLDLMVRAESIPLNCFLDIADELSDK